MKKLSTDHPQQEREFFLKKKPSEADELSVQVPHRGGVAASSMFMVMEDEGQYADRAQHRAHKELVIALHPMELELAGAVEGEGHQRSHDGDCAAK